MLIEAPASLFTYQHDFILFATLDQISRFMPFIRLLGFKSFKIHRTLDHFLREIAAVTTALFFADETSLLEAVVGSIGKRLRV
jgi:hypothetical protein